MLSLLLLLCFNFLIILWTIFIIILVFFCLSVYLFVRSFMAEYSVQSNSAANLSDTTIII